MALIANKSNRLNDRGIQLLDPFLVTKYGLLYDSLLALTCKYSFDQKENVN